MTQVRHVPLFLAARERSRREVGGSDWPNSSNTGVPQGTSLTVHSGQLNSSSNGQVINAMQVDGALVITHNNVTVTNSLINGQVFCGDGVGYSGYTTGFSMIDCTIDCGCLSVGSSDTPVGVGNSDFSLLRCDVFNVGHPIAIRNHHVIQDSYLHGLGGNTEAHKDGIFSGGGTDVMIRHNTITACDGPIQGVTAAIGLLTDFEDQTFTTIDNNLLNACGSYTLYASGGPAKSFSTNNLTVTNNHFGTTYFTTGSELGPVTYFDSGQPGMVWLNNIWHDGPNAGQSIPPVY